MAAAVQYRLLLRLAKGIEGFASRRSDVSRRQFELHVMMHRNAIFPVPFTAAEAAVHAKVSTGNPTSPIMYTSLARWISIRHVCVPLLTGMNSLVQSFCLWISLASTSHSISLARSESSISVSSCFNT